eukprot:GAHX01002414.1.p1 GENE.GAHX01002414.1~~GAHX01002414.1.p1  ORF type:complete len:374 (+),score=56.76 GAHX01002414.1:702-1823(+)
MNERFSTEPGSSEGLDSDCSEYLPPIKTRKVLRSDNTDLLGLEESSTIQTLDLTVVSPNSPDNPKKSHYDDDSFMSSLDPACEEYNQIQQDYPDIFELPTSQEQKKRHKPTINQTNPFDTTYSLTNDEVWGINKGFREMPFIPYSEYLQNDTNSLGIYLNLISDEVMADITKYTNVYMLANKKQWNESWCYEMTSTELIKFIGAFLFMSIVKLNSINDYFSKDKIYGELYIRKMFTKNRFLIILRSIHFCCENKQDNDKLKKLRTFFNKLNNNFDALGEKTKDLTLDKSLISCRSRLHFIQYIPNKKAKFGIKIYKVCNSDGYILTTKIYSGKEEEVNNKKLMHGYTYDLVSSLTEKYLNRNHVFYMDNFLLV